MSSDSEEDAEQRQRFLQAADSTFFSDALFQPAKNDLKLQNNNASTELGNNITEKNNEGKTILGRTDSEAHRNNARKSQRYLAEEECNVNADINVPETVRQHVYKKLIDVIHQRVKFCDFDHCKSIQDKVVKDELTLLKGANCYVKPYEEFVSDYKRPHKKPVVKKRFVDFEEYEIIDERKRLKAAVIEPEVLLNGTDVQMWAKKPDRPDKYFRYKLGSKGQLVALDNKNEFSKLRQKNNWNESKINKKI